MTMFTKALFAVLPDEQVAINGKVLRGAIMDALKQPALHLVQAFPGASLVLGLRQGQRRERNIMVEIQKFCKHSYQSSLLWRSRRVTS